ncbi:MAG: motility associated factor glycosyltransferase family protein [Spirochaetales bacterium]|nr:motility associated factor glycosyltransferase family protein [Spirochaetales bacterium]
MNCFERNLKVLRQKHANFDLPPESVDAGQNDDILTLQAASGETTAMRNGIFLHSRLDPRREARRLVMGLRNPDCTVFFGFGLGYYVEEYLAGYPDGTAIVVEPDSRSFALVLRARDLTEVLESPRLILILSADPEALAEVLNAFPFSTPGVLAPRSLVRFNEDYFRRLQAVIDSFTARREINRNTLKRFGRRWVRNLAANIPHLPGARKFSDLVGRYTDVPALVLAAGPSLDQLLDHLPALAERFLILAVDTSLRAVLRTGVSPDFLVVVDPQYWNARHLDGCVTGDTVLITESATYPTVFRYPYRAVFFGASLFPLGAALEREIGSFGKLGAGGSVATSAWDAARQMGCSPVFAAGLDLGYPAAGTHFKGGRFEELQLCGAGRFAPAETGNYKSINDAAPFFTESNSGAAVLTDKRLVVYKWWFENQLKMYTDVRCGNLSGGGVRIEGMAYTPLKELLAYPEIRRDLRSAAIEGLAAGDSSVIRRKRLLKAGVRDLICALESLKALASRALALTNEMDNQNGTFNKGILEELNHIDAELLSHKAKDVAGFLIQDVAQEILEERPTTANREQIKQQSMRMYRNLRVSAEYHIEILRQVPF